MKQLILPILFILPFLASCKHINTKFNNDKNDYFTIREPDSVFFSKKGQQELLKEFNAIIFENREEKEAIGVRELFNEIDEKMEKSQNIDILYARPEPVISPTFHWNVFSIHRDVRNNVLYIISNENDKKAKEMVKVLNIFKSKYSKVKIIYLPQIQYSYKGCSIKGAMFIKEIHKNNDELLNVLIKIAKQHNKNREIHIQELINGNQIDDGDKKIIIQRYLKFIQKDNEYYEFVNEGIIKDKHNNWTRIKTDRKTGKDIYIKNSKLHDKGYSYIYNDLLTKDDVLKNTKVTKKDILEINDGFQIKKEGK